MAHILLAEDEFLVALLIEEVLTQAGHRVSVAANGVDALALAESSVIDLLVTDVRMPRMDGFTLVARLRALHPKLPVVVMTGYPGEDAERSLGRLSREATVFLKPVETERLLQEIETLLSH
jgi:CheY-like chemotaxis protein